MAERYNEDVRAELKSNVEAAQATLRAADLELTAFDRYVEEQGDLSASGKTKRQALFASATLTHWTGNSAPRRNGS